MGLVAEGPLAEDEPFYLWPECLPVFRVWQRIQTQWVRGMGAGVLGLHYPGVDIVIRHLVPKSERTDTFALIQAMEIAHINAQRIET